MKANKGNSQDCPSLPPSQDKKKNKNKLIYKFNLKTSKPKNLFLSRLTSSLMSVSYYDGSMEAWKAMSLLLNSRVESISS